MGPKRRRFSREFKLEAVRLICISLEGAALRRGHAHHPWLDEYAAPA